MLSFLCIFQKDPPWARGMNLYKLISDQPIFILEQSKKKDYMLFLVTGNCPLPTQPAVAQSSALVRLKSPLICALIKYTGVCWSSLGQSKFAANSTSNSISFLLSVMQAIWTGVLP